ncbi:response regulator [Maribacter sp. X9]|uniref:response regulator n=1 Tax=Maribacter sp. X9 TaxID=3402159 RepID=UPI003AF3B7DF
MSNLKLTLFLADDDHDDRLLFTEALFDLPFNITVRSFENGVDLIAALLDYTTILPDLIFLDLNMPLMNGEECLDDIKAEPDFCAIPIIIYSSYSDPDKIESLKRKGAELFIQKPGSFADLKLKLNEVMLELSPIKSGTESISRLGTEIG